jgi:hypothetical protein
VLLVVGGATLLSGAAKTMVAGLGTLIIYVIGVRSLSMSPRYNCLAPLRRRHHRAKQAQGWRLDQPEPGVLVWTLPHGRSYRVQPPACPGDGAG